MERLCIWLPVPISELDFNNNNWLQFQFVKSWEHYTKNKVGGGILVDYCVQNSVRCTYTGALTHRGNTQPHTPIPIHSHPYPPLHSRPNIPPPTPTHTHTPPHTSTRKALSLSEWWRLKRWLITVVYNHQPQNGTETNTLVNVQTARSSSIGPRPQRYACTADWLGFVYQSSAIWQVGRDRVYLVHTHMTGQRGFSLYPRDRSGCV